VNVKIVDTARKDGTGIGMVTLLMVIMVVTMHHIGEKTLRLHINVPRTLLKKTLIQ